MWHKFSFVSISCAAQCSLQNRRAEQRVTPSRLSWWSALATLHSNYRTIAFISQANKVMLKILQAWLQQYVNHELPDVQAGFRKGRGTRDQIANICWIIEKAREFQIKSTSDSLTLEPLTVCITTNCGKFFKRWEYQTT